MVEEQRGNAERAARREAAAERMEALQVISSAHQDLVSAVRCIFWVVVWHMDNVSKTSGLEWLSALLAGEAGG